MNLEPFGIEWENRRVGRLQEFIKVVRGLLDSRDPFSFDGSFHRVDRAILTVRPYQDRKIPIYLAALGPQMQRYAGRVAQGWLPTVLPAAYWAEYFAPVADAAQRSGRNPGEVAQVASIPVVLLDEGQKLSQEQLVRFARPFAGTLVWPVVVERMGLKFNPPEHLADVSYHTVNPCDPQSLAQFKEYAAWLPGEVLTRFLVVGTLLQVRRQLGEYVDAGVTQLSLYNASPDPIWAATTLATEVLPYFNGRRATLPAKLFRLGAWPFKKLGLTRKAVPRQFDFFVDAGL